MKYVWYAISGLFGAITLGGLITIATTDSRQASDYVTITVCALIALAFFRMGKRRKAKKEIPRVVVRSEQPIAAKQKKVFDKKEESNFFIAHYGEYLRQELRKNGFSEEKISDLWAYLSAGNTSHLDMGWWCSQGLFKSFCPQGFTWAMLKELSVRCNEKGFPSLWLSPDSPAKTQWNEMLKYVYSKARTRTDLERFLSLNIERCRLRFFPKIQPNYPLMKWMQHSGVFPPYYPGDETLLEPIIPAFESTSGRSDEDNEGISFGVRLEWAVVDLIR